MAMTLAQVREKYPYYKDFDDQTLADALYKKYYPHADRREFDARVGLKPYQNVGEATLTALGNLPANVEKGKQGVAQMAGEAMTDLLAPQARVPKPVDVKTPEPPVGSGDWLRGRDGIALDAPGPLDAFPEIRDPLAKAAAKTTLAAKLRILEARKREAQIDVAPGSFEEIVSQGIASTAEMTPSIAASVALRNPWPAMVYAGTMAGGQSYVSGRDSGLTPEQARQYGALYAAAEGLPEALPVGFIIKEGGTLLGRIGGGAVAEAVQEGFTEALQSLIDSKYIDPTMTWDEAWPRIKTAALTGLVAGGFMGTVAHGVDTVGTMATRQPQPGDPLFPETDEPIEESIAPPAVPTLLALPPPDRDPRRPINDVRPEDLPGRAPKYEPPTDEQLMEQAAIAARATRQKETAELVRTARETITPLGTFTMEELQAGEQKPAAQKVREWRIRTGRDPEEPVSIEDMARARVPQSQIDALIATRRPFTEGDPLLTPDGVRAAAKQKNLVTDDANFAELAYRSTGSRNLERMSQAQLRALAGVIDLMPAHAKPVTIPIADRDPVSEPEYDAAVSAVRKEGRVTLKAIMDAAGTTDQAKGRAIRDAMVRRGQIVKYADKDYRLYDVTGQERQAVPDDLPPGAFKEHVVRRLPVGEIRVRQNGKTVGVFGSGSAARERVRAIREADAKNGRTSTVEISNGPDVAYGVLENRYDSEGNYLGQVVVDTHRSESDALRAADKLNGVEQLDSPDGAIEAAPKRRPPPPEALAGRIGEVVERLGEQARARNLPLLGVQVKLVEDLAAPEGRAEGVYWQKLIALATAHLDKDMTTDQIVEALARVMDHETIHALRAAGVLGPKTKAWQVLGKYVAKARRPDTKETYLQWARRNYKGVQGYEDDSSIEEEAIAEAFRYWAASRRNVTGQPGTVFRQLVQWFRNLLQSIPEDLFRSIESGSIVTDALKPPGSEMPRARATRKMNEARAGVRGAEAAVEAAATNEAERLIAENLARIRGREFIRARAQAREDRVGRSGPKTVLGTTPGRAYATGDLMDRAAVGGYVKAYNDASGHPDRVGLRTYLPEDIGYLKRVADAQQRGVHAPNDPAVRKAYGALAAETRQMYQALGEPEIAPWDGEGPAYQSPAELLADVRAGRVKMRLTEEMFGEGADNPNHPMYEGSGWAATDGSPLLVNDLFRLVHDIFGYGQIGLRDTPGGAYNAYHEHAKLLSPEARKALATETLAQSAWANYGPHLRRSDGTVPRETDVDYLPPAEKEFAEQKAFLLDDELIGEDPGWQLAAEAEQIVAENPRYMVAWHGTPHVFDKFSSDKIGTGEGAQAYGYGLYFAGKKEVAQWYREQLAGDNVSLVLRFPDGRKDTLTFEGEWDDPKLYAARSIRDEADSNGGQEGAVDRAIQGLQMQLDEAEIELERRRSIPDEGGRVSYGESMVKMYRDAIAAAEQWKSEGLEGVATQKVGRLFKVDIPNDDELMDWDAPLSEQPPKVKAILRKEGFGEHDDPTGREIYEHLERQMAVDAPAGSLMAKVGDKVKSPERASQYLRDLGLPGHRYIGHESQSTNYVIYDDSRIQIIEVDGPKFSKFDDELPGGRLYGNPKRSPGGLVSKPLPLTPMQLGYRQDNPAVDRGEEGRKWLESKIALAASRPNAIGGATTAYFQKPLLLPTALLANLPGARGEQRRPGEAQYDALDRTIAEKGWDQESKNAILVEINHLGEPFIVEGNTRVAYAARNNIDTIRTEVKWLNGGETVEGVWAPDRVAAQAKNTSAPFTNERDGIRFFEGEMVGRQLEMATTGERGTTMIYLSPEEYLAVAGGEAYEQQGVIDGAIDEGYKFSTLPSVVLDGYAGIVRVASSDGDYAARALAGRANRIPVIVYPGRSTNEEPNLGLVTALEGNGNRVNWPHEGRQENIPSIRGPRFSVGSEAFKRWFGDSKVVDENGEPLVVYHGTVDQIEVFRPELTSHRAFFFSASAKHAEGYTGQAGRNIIPAYLMLEDPLIVQGHVTRSYGDMDALLEQADAGGHDGVIIRNHDDQGSVADTYVAFDSRQIKSVNNRGTFDAANPDIRYSLNAPFGSRVPPAAPPSAFNIVYQRTDGMIGRFIKSLGRSKAAWIPGRGGLFSIFDARIKLQDEHLTLKEMAEDLRERGGKVNDLNDAYMLAQLYHGRVVTEIRKREEALLEPLLDAIRTAEKNAKVNVRDFEDYLYARHTPERNAFLRARGSPIDNPAGQSDAEAAEVMDRFAKAGKIPVLEQLARLAYQITADTTNTRVEAGLISRKAADSSPYKFYVPLRGYAEEDLDPDLTTDGATRARSGKGFSVGGREDRAVTGRSRKAGELLAHLFLQNTESVIRAEKNRVAQSFLRLVADNRGSGYAEILPGAPTRLVVAKNGTIHEAGDPGYRQDPNIVIAKFEGREMIARVADPRLARAIKSDYVTSSGNLIRFMGMANRYLAMINTSLNPEFLLSNLARDAQTAGILSAQFDIKGFGGKILGNAPRAMNGIRKVLFNGDTNNRWSQAFLEMQEAGGTTEFLGIHDLETRINQIRRSIGATGLHMTARQVQDRIGQIFGIVDKANQIAENAFRLSAFVAAREAGASVNQAAYLAKNLTVNFNKGGEWKTAMNAWYLFYNASLQGSMVLVNGLKNKRVRRLAGAVVVLGLLQDIVNRVLGGGDEDDNGVPDYDDVPEYVLHNNFVIMTPWGNNPKTGGKGYLAIPMPYGFNAFYNLGRNIGAVSMGRKNPLAAAADVGLVALDSFNPLGGVNSIANFIAPTVADPFVDLLSNRDFAGSTIVPERPTFGVPVPESQKYWSSVEPWAKETAAQLNKLTGGNAIRSGLIDMSPEVLEYWYDFALGGAGRFAMRMKSFTTEKLPSMLVGDFEDVSVGDVPILRRVVGSVDNRAGAERYYRIADEIATVAAELKFFEEEGDVVALRQVLARSPLEARLVPAFEDAHKALSDLRKEIRELEANDAVPEARKRDVIDTLRRQQDVVMAQMVKLYQRLKEGR